MNAPATDRTVEEMIRDYMASIIEPGQVTELWVPANGTHPVRRGFFDNLDDFAREAADIDGTVAGCYFTLNPLRPDIMQRSPNKVTASKGGDCARNSDVIRRRWLPLDFDPFRGSHTNSTDKELNAAFDVAKHVMRACLRKGWARPLTAMSGNGWHLLFPIDLAPSDQVVKETIHRLARQYSTAGVTIDRAVHNPARLWKVYGTVAAKGPHTAERPQRRSILFGPRVVRQ